MSILIEGAKMPKDETCMFIHVDYNEKGKLCAFVVYDRGERLLGELQPVPTPHGRLIDANELLKGKSDHDTISTHEIWNAPTVIESEE